MYANARAVQKPVQVWCPDQYQIHPTFIVKDESGWDRLIRRMKDDIRQAQEGAIRRRHADSKTGSPNTSARMHTFGCSVTGGGRTKVAGRAGKTNPELTKTLKDAAAKHGELEQACEPYDCQDMLRKTD